MRCSSGHDAYNASCMDCLYELPPPPVRRPREAAEFSYPAKYPGQCPICDLPIQRGQRCSTTNRERVVHSSCL